MTYQLKKHAKFYGLRGKYFGPFKLILETTGSRFSCLVFFSSLIYEHVKKCYNQKSVIIKNVQ